MGGGSGGGGGGRGQSGAPPARPADSLLELDLGSPSPAAGAAPPSSSGGLDDLFGLNLGAPSQPAPAATSSVGGGLGGLDDLFGMSSSMPAPSMGAPPPSSNGMSHSRKKMHRLPSESFVFWGYVSTSWKCDIWILFRVLTANITSVVFKSTRVRIRIQLNISEHMATLHSSCFIL